MSYDKPKFFNKETHPDCRSDVTRRHTYARKTRLLGYWWKSAVAVEYVIVTEPGNALERLNEQVKELERLVARVRRDWVQSIDRTTAEVDDTEQRIERVLAMLVSVERDLAWQTAEGQRVSNQLVDLSRQIREDLAEMRVLSRDQIITISKESVLRGPSPTDETELALREFEAEFAVLAGKPSVGTNKRRVYIIAGLISILPVLWPILIRPVDVWRLPLQGFVPLVILTFVVVFLRERRRRTEEINDMACDAIAVLDGDTGEQIERQPSLREVSEIVSSVRTWLYFLEFTDQLDMLDRNKFEIIQSQLHRTAESIPSRHGVGG